MVHTKFTYFFIVLFIALGPCFSSFAQVNMQTGSAVFSIPMFEWKDDKSRLFSAVALSYSSGSGLKVNDIASNVGQGWNLTAGGVITRMQAGEPDDQPAYAGAYPSRHDQDVTKYPAGYLYAPSTAPMENGCPAALTYYPTYGGKNVLYAAHNEIAQDRQLDRFAFQFNGKSGIFVIDTSGGWHGVALGDTKMKISLQLDPTMTSQGIRTTITSFTITDVDGLIYKFTQHGLTKLLKAVFSNADGSKTSNQPKISNGGVYCQSGFDVGPTAGPTWYNQYMANPFIISNWYLTEIDDPFLSRKILFSYVPRNLSNAAGTDITFNKSLNNYVVVSYKKSVTAIQEISSITFPDGHVVNFTYATVPRFDYAGQYALSTVNISYNGRSLSQYQLNTTYFIGNRYGTPSTPFQQRIARLCLRGVKKIGVDLKEDSPPYQFDYYLGSSADDVVPAPFSYSKDIWGYYNGNNSIASNSPTSGTTIPVPLNVAIPYTLGFNALKGLCFQNDNVTGTYYNAKSGYAKNGLLKQIIYPTGGSLAYQYAQNTGAFIQTPGTVLSVGGVHVSQTSSSDGGYSNGCGNPIVTKYDYVMNGAGSASSLWGLETPVNNVVSNNDWKEEHKTIHFSFSYPLGTCLWHYIYPGILSQYEAVNLDAFQKIMTALSPVLGILSVVATVNDIINVVGGATGFLAIAAVVLDVISAVFSYILSCPQLTKYTPNTIYYNFDLNMAAPLPAQFKRVEITESSGAIGKTVQQFTHGDPNDAGRDYALWSTAGSNTAFSVKQRFAPWAYGLPRFTTVYDVNGNKIKETENVYDFTHAQEVLFDPGDCCATSYWSIVSYKCQVITNHSQRSDDWSNINKYNAPSSYTKTSTSDMTVDGYYTYTGRTELAKTYERIYRTTDVTQFVQTETDYTYYSGMDCIADNYCQKVAANYEVRQIATKQSNGDTYYKYISYPTNFNTGALATLVQKNIYSIPVAILTWVVKSGGSTAQYLSEKVTEFTQLSNSDIKPYRMLEQRFTSPVTSLTGYTGPTTTNYANYKIPQVFSYDANGNLVGQQDEGNRVVTNIYDYNDKYIVASVINANAATDKPAYTSFESLDLSRSGWTLSGTSSYAVNVTSVTGKNAFTLLPSGMNSLTASALNTATAYILSFWAIGSFTVPAGSTLLKSGPTYNGYTYYEYNIPAGTSSVVFKNNNAANCTIDELRLYPVNARMRTTTYDPLLGKTSECDENNRIIYYTYDNLGRKQFVQDEVHNIVKMFEYNNVSAALRTGCPATYSNQMILEPVVRSNCGAGYQGGTTPYTVPAGQFTSTMSQEDADNQAETYFLTNAQNYANNPANNAACYLIYYNTAKSETDSTTSCDPGYKGGMVTYTVPASTYSSIVSQADADQQALDDVAANALAYVNSPDNRSCIIDNTPDWEWFPGDGVRPADPSYCLSVNGNLPPHLFVQATDVNPSSSTYNQKQWQDYGPNDACPANTYYNAQQSQTFTKTCSAGYTGSQVTYTVPPGKYSSTASQSAATQLALNDIAANGQHYADSLGTCTPNQHSGHLSMPGSTASTTFTTSVVGNITLQIDGDPGNTYSINYTLNGPSNKSGNLCAQRSTTTCSYPESVTFTNMPVGTYTLSIQMGSGSAVSRGVSYTYY